MALPLLIFIMADRNFSPQMLVSAFRWMIIFAFALRSVFVLPQFPASNITPIIQITHGPNLTAGVHRQGDGCFHVFLDVGANIGVHGRFLFEPEKYPKAGIARSIFDSEFGSDRDKRDICSFEFEPNPAHQQKLKRNSRAYQDMGWRYEYIQAAAGDFEGYMDFHHNADEENEEWGFSVKKLVESDTVVEKVPVLRLSSWIKQHITERLVPSSPFGQNSNFTPTIVMKMDIEGSEYVVLPDLIFSGALCTIDFLFGEFHPWFAPMNFSGQKIKLETRRDAAHLGQLLSEIIGTSRNCKTRFKYLDDESYLHDGIPLPFPSGS